MVDYDNRKYCLNPTPYIQLKKYNPNNWEWLAATTR